MKRTITITGVDGFVGRHLASLAHEAGHDVIGIARAPQPHPDLARVLSSYHAADLRVSWPEGAVGDAIIHLAGLAAVGPSFDQPQAYISGNSAMVTAMCESILRTRKMQTRVVGVSTGAVYGSPAEHAGQSEDSPVAFTSPYAVSKLLVENQLAYYRNRGIDTVIARPFNHIGPGQSSGFLVPDLIAQLSGLPADGTLSVGNLETRRDYTDVRDVARAYLMLATAGSHEHLVYNVASGTSRSGSWILQQVCAALGRPVPPIEVDPRRIRATDPPEIVGDAGRLNREYAWSPQVPLERSIADAVALLVP